MIWRRPGRCWPPTPPPCPSLNSPPPSIARSALPGIHFFNPVHRMPLVEVITGEKTSAETAAAAVRFVQKIGKMPVLVRDSPGFLVNRILLPYMVEAVELFAHGAAIGEVDMAMLDFGMPMGPLRLIDEVGLDIAQEVAATLAAAFPGHMHLPAVLSRMLDAGLLGRKTGRGFYVHKKGKAVPNKEATGYRDATATAVTLNRAAMQRRMVLLMVNEAARCIEEKVVAEACGRRFRDDHGRGLPTVPRRAAPVCRFAGNRRASPPRSARRRRSGAPFTPCELLRRNDPNKQEFLCRQLTRNP